MPPGCQKNCLAYRALFKTGFIYSDTRHDLCFTYILWLISIELIIYSVTSCNTFPWPLDIKYFDKLIISLSLFSLTIHSSRAIECVFSMFFGNLRIIENDPSWLKIPVQRVHIELLTDSLLYFARWEEIKGMILLLDTYSCTMP